MIHSLSWMLPGEAVGLCDTGEDEGDLGDEMNIGTQKVVAKGRQRKTNRREEEKCGNEDMRRDIR